MNCARCDAADAPILAYFGPELCRPCAQHGADLYDRIGRWPRLPPDWQQALKALGPLAVTRIPPQPRPPVSAANPAPSPPEVKASGIGVWRTCDHCGEGALIGLLTEHGNPRNDTRRCFLTPGCKGRYRTTFTTTDDASTPTPKEIP